MALNKVAQAQLGKFGKLTATGHSQKDKSIFGSTAYSTVCSYTDSFNSLSLGDDSAFDITSEKGMENLNKEMDIMTGNDKKTTNTKKFEMNMKSFALLQQELSGNNGGQVTLNS